MNLFLAGMGADLWGRGTLVSGLVLASAIIPVFCWRHYIVDGGKFPNSDLNETPQHRAAGLLPYLALAFGGVVIAVGHAYARY